MKLEVGSYIQSESALIHCLSEASYNPHEQAIEVDTKTLRPNILPKITKHGTKEPVWHGKTKKGWVDVRNDDPSRALSIWEITEAKTDPHGCGSTSMANYGRTEMWARYFYKAKRVNIDGSDHPSNEVLSFSSAGSFIVKDLTRVRLPD